MPASSRAQEKGDADAPAAMPPLNDEERRIILNKGTEAPFSGKYWNHFKPGVYVCRRCGAELYRSTSKFQSDCGWPSFDEEIAGAVKRQPDADGIRVEIICANCGAHLGHVFMGEGLTPRDTRHCVNSMSLVFRAGPASRAASSPATKPAAREAIFAGGCFWGVEHLFKGMPGVISATSGYTGGHVKNPTYEQVCAGRTGHVEAVRVVYDPAKTTYERLARRFFEIHDPTTKDRQGPDVGYQYRSVIFYGEESEKATAERLIRTLKGLGYDVVTEVAPVSEFYPAEEYHQDYLAKHPGRYDCHVPVARFEKRANAKSKIAD